MNTKDSANDKAEQESKKPARSTDQEIEEAVERIYRHYGSDLAAFVRDVQKDIQKRSAAESNDQGWKSLSM